MPNKSPNLGLSDKSTVKLLTLKRTALAPKLKTVLEAMLSSMSSLIEEGLKVTFNEVDQFFFKLAEQAKSNDQQNRCFEALREIKRGRPDVTPRFMLLAESALASSSQPSQAPEFSRVNRSKSNELDLVDPREFEESLALHEIASKYEVRCSQALYFLGQRFGVLTGSKALEADEIPLGPQQLCEFFRRAIADLDLSLEHKISIFRIFDRCCLSLLSKLLEKANSICVENRILPNLASMQTTTRRVEQTEAIPAQKKKTSSFSNNTKDVLVDQEKKSEQAQIQAPSLSQPENKQRSGGALGQQTKPLTAPSSGAQDLPALLSAAFANPMVGWPSMHLPMADSHTDSHDLETFDAMRELLSDRHQAMGRPGTSTDSISTHRVRTEDIQAVLSTLQTKPQPPVLMGGKLTNRSVAHLKEDLLSQLRQITPENKTPKLTEVDNDTIDLVDMLFDHLFKNDKATRPAQDLVSRLQTPLVRVALEDKTFITRKSHPARQFLNTIGEASLFWFDDETQDRQLVEKLQMIVDRVVREYDGNVEIFNEANTDLTKHLATLSRKSEVAERRHVDAARGRERLEVARTVATGAINHLLADSKPSALLKTLLEQAWTDVLALTVLRHGQDSDTYKKRLSVAKELLETSTEKQSSSQKPISKTLQTEVEQALAQVGYHADDVQAITHRIFALPAQGAKAQSEDSASLTELAIKLKKRSRLGAETEAGDPDKPAAKELPPLSAEEQKVLARLRTIPFGTWFDFKINQQGDIAKRKLSWFSTLSGRCLFVNQHGVRSDECTLEQLAKDLVRGQVSIVEQQKNSLIDRAWNAIMNTLQTFSGGLSSATPA
jgi:O6-methylguanine-DNA--protein-cysteine methyltransferase